MYISRSAYDICSVKKVSKYMNLWYMLFFSKAVWSFPNQYLRTVILFVMLGVWFSKLQFFSVKFLFLHGYGFATGQDSNDWWDNRTSGKEFHITLKIISISNSQSLVRNWKMFSDIELISSWIPNLFPDVFNRNLITR